VPVVLFFFREVDDNRLTSWQWVFTVANPLSVYGAVLAGLAASWFLSRLALPGPRVLFLLAFLAGSLFWREPEVIVDASRYFTQAKHLELYGAGYFLREWGGEIEAWTDMPLVPFLYGLVFKLGGEKRVLVQILSTLMFSGTAALTALMGRELWDEGTGNAAGALLLGFPYLYTQVPLMLADVPSMFLLVLSAWLFLKALKDGGLRYIVPASLAVFGAVFAKYSLWLLLSVLGAVFLVRLREGGRATLKRAALTGLVSAALIGAGFLAYAGVIREQIELLVEFQTPGLGWWGERFVSTFFFQVHPFITAGALYALYAAVRKRDLRFLIAAWLVLLLLGMQVRRIRYLLPVFPMLSLMAAYGFAEIGTERVRRFLVVSAVVSSLALGVFGYLPLLGKFDMANLKDAGRFLDTLEAGEVRVVTLPQRSTVNPAVAVPLLDLYTEKDITYDYVLRTHLTRERIRRLPLRFTWRYRNPVYYRPQATGTGGEEGAAYAVIAPRVEGTEGEVPEGYRMIKTFNNSAGLHRFRPFVGVYAIGY
jgi:hypothetical protein